MGEKPKNFQQAIEDLEHTSDSNGTDFRSRLEQEFSRLEETLNKIKPHIEDLQSKVGDEVKKTKQTVESQVKENPWAAIGIIGLIFFVIGFLLGSRGPRGRD